jgi:predicted HTH domain antitoxin
MNFPISKKILKSAHLTEKEIKQELALALYKKDKLTLAQASRLAKMDRLQFQHLLASKKINIHYSKKDFEDDLKVIESLK